MAKRALVVDDSKSARAFLAKLLEEQQVEVDAAETAEQALDYLMHNRPDVIFMDHLMPGMDGFQAVQAIKGNPRTATIPILMYTSQEGELYLGQARALGAVGVVSKSLAATDVRTVLRQLQLADQPPQAAVEEALMDHETTAEFAAPLATSALPSQAPNPVFEELLKAEVAALRQHMAEALDASRAQLLRDVRSLIPEPAPAPVLAAAPVIEPDPPRHSPLAWILALAASVAAAIVGTLLWKGQQQVDALRSELMDSRSTVALLTARLAPAPEVAESSLPAVLQPADAVVVLPVPFGEQPLAGGRVEALREFAARVAALGQRGTVEVRRYAGRFCLAGSNEAGYLLAAGATPATGCDLVAEATDPLLAKEGLESAAFTGVLAELRKQYSALFNIDVGAGRGEVSGSAYPDLNGNAPQPPTAADWNAIASDNNRVEIRWHPAT